MDNMHPFYDELEKKINDPKSMRIEIVKPDPMEVMAEVLNSLKVNFDEAVKSNDYVTIMKYSEAMTDVAKGITEMQSGKGAIAMMERTITELRKLMDT